MKTKLETKVRKFASSVSVSKWLQSNLLKSLEMLLLLNRIETKIYWPKIFLIAEVFL